MIDYRENKQIYIYKWSTLEKKNLYFKQSCMCSWHYIQNNNNKILWNDVYRGGKYYGTDHNDVNRQADYLAQLLILKNRTNYDVFLINVCGLKTRLNYPDFNELLLSHDLCILTETKCDVVDISVMMSSVPLVILSYTKNDTNLLYIALEE